MRLLPSLLKDTPNPTDQQINEAMYFNICRCGPMCAESPSSLVAGDPMSDTPAAEKDVATNPPKSSGRLRWLVGVLGIVAGESAVPFVKHLIGGHPPAV
jgi:hypothetical protein